MTNVNPSNPANDYNSTENEEELLESNGSENGHDQTGNRNSSKSPLHPDATLKIRLLIHTLQVGAVIGRAGERIKGFRKNYNAVIEVVSDSENQIPERVITMSASIKNLLGIMSELIPCMNENQPSILRHSLQSHGSYSVRLLVHYVVAGSVIGTGGANIRQLRQKSGATITVFHDCCPGSSDRVILAVGSLEAVLMTMASVLDTVAETDVRGQTFPYSPFQSYDPRLVSTYGGFAMLDPYGQEVASQYGPYTRSRYYDHPSYSLPPPLNMPTRLPPPLSFHSGPPPPMPSETRGTKRQRQPVDEFAPVPPPPPPLPHYIPPLVQETTSRYNLNGDDGYTGGYYLPSSSGEKPAKMSRQANNDHSSNSSNNGDSLPPTLMPAAHHYPPPIGPYEQPLPSLSAATAAASSFDFPRLDAYDPPPLLPHVPPLLPAQPPVQSTEQYTIPPEAAGAVIGPRGKRAHFVRQSTGCRVTISDDVTKSGNRVITLTGSKAQVAAAKHHMRSFLAEFYRNQKQSQESQFGVQVSGGNSHCN